MLTKQKQVVAAAVSMAAVLVACLVAACWPSRTKQLPPESHSPPSFQWTKEDEERERKIDEETERKKAKLDKALHDANAELDESRKIGLLPPAGLTPVEQKKWEEDWKENYEKNLRKQMLDK